MRGFVEKALHCSTFGNARFVRNLLEDAIVAQSVRLSGQLSDDGADDGQGRAPSVEELSLLLAEDFIWEGEGFASGRTVGFAA